MHIIRFHILKIHIEFDNANRYKILIHSTLVVASAASFGVSRQMSVLKNAESADSVFVLLPIPIYEIFRSRIFL